MMLCLVLMIKIVKIMIEIWKIWSKNQIELQKLVRDYIKKKNFSKKEMWAKENLAILMYNKIKI